MHLIKVAFLCLMTFTATFSEVHKTWPETHYTSHPSHYPCFCTFTDAIFRWEDEKFYFKYDGNGSALTSKCRGLHIWEIENDPVMEDVICDSYYDVGYAYTIYYWGRGSNYFHLFYDMVIPLYQDIYMGKSRDDLIKQKLLFMPTVETSRMKILNWNTDAFIPPQDEKYWNQIAKQVAGDYDYMPLDRSFIDQKKNICFKELKFGTPGVKFENEILIKGVSKYIIDTLNIERIPFRAHKIGIITRKNRRKIVNEQELLDSIKPTYDIELVEFSGKTFKEQVQMMQHYSVLVGINGAGLMNSLFLPPYAVSVQLVPYKAMVNFVNYGKLLKSRGPYLEWHNEHENLTHRLAGDTHNNRADTVVHVEEFKELMEKAVTEAETHKNLLLAKDEL